MDEPIVILPREIPQDSFALGAVAPPFAELIQHPELLSMCGGVLLEFPMCQPPTESSLADT